MTPSNSAIQNALGLARAGKIDAAVASLRRLVQKDASDLAAAQSLGQLLVQTGQTEPGLFQFQRCVRLLPGAAHVRNNYGLALWQAGRTREAVEQFRESVRLDSGYALGWIGLSMALMGVPDYEGAKEAAERAIALKPEIGGAYLNLGLAQIESGEMDAGLVTLRRGLEVEPGHAEMRSMSLMAGCYRSIPAEEALEAHRQFGVIHAGAAGVRPAMTPCDPERRLRIGYLSRDFREHSVAYFAAAMLEHRERGAFESVCYSAATVDDGMTKKIKGWCDRWVAAAFLDDAALERRIREDGIDILVDLAGHSAGHRLGALVNRPAPVIITAIGYPHTTGIPAIGHRLVDSLTDPPGTERFATERLLRLDPCFLCYRAPEGAPEPEVAGASHRAGAAVTFGSFNALPKIGPEVVAAWAGVLKAVPGSRLLLKARAFDDADVRERVAGWFVGAGIEGERVEILPPSRSQREHLALYGRVDIALDTFPYNGTTTTCEALWMGVPVVTLAGGSHAGRVGVSLLTAAGLPELVAGGGEEYISIAAGLARDRARLGNLRGTLRGRVSASPLCDGRGYSVRWHGALRGVWREHCGDSRL